MAKYNGKTVLFDPVILPVSDGSIGTDQLADGSVTTAKLANSAVTAAKIKDGAVSTSKLVNGAIKNEKIGTLTIKGGADNPQLSRIYPNSIDKADLAEYNGIPFVCTRIRYLRGTGTQYIDTGIVPVLEKDGSNITKFTGFELVVQYAQSGGTSADQMYWFGAADTKSQSNNIVTNGINVYGNPNGRLWTIYSDKAGVFSSTNVYGRVRVSPYTRTSIGTFYNGSWVEGPSPAAFTQNANLYLFALNINNGSPLISTACIMQSAVISEYTWNATSGAFDEEVKADMVPVLDENGIPAMYDRKRQQYLYNAGTGQFLWG